MGIAQESNRDRHRTFLEGGAFACYHLHEWNAGGDVSDDLIQILKERAEIAQSLAREVPGHLSNPDLTLEQATQLYQALEQQSQAMERFLEILEDREADDNVLEAAEAIDNMFSDLAAAAAEKMMSLTPRREEDPAAAGVRHARVLAGLP